MKWIKGKKLGFKIEWSTEFAELNRLTHIMLTNDLFIIRISKHKQFNFWFHKPKAISWDRPKKYSPSRCFITTTFKHKTKKVK